MYYCIIYIYIFLKKIQLFYGCFKNNSFCFSVYFSKGNGWDVSGHLIVRGSLPLLLPSLPILPPIERREVKTSVPLEIWQKGKEERESQTEGGQNNLWQLNKKQFLTFFQLKSLLGEVCKLSKIQTRPVYCQHKSGVVLGLVLMFF